jgi:FUN14 domain-containing protein 1
MPLQLLSQLGFGGLMGICTGVAMKRIGNGAAAIIGVGFICLQGLSYMGYITVDYNKVR